MHNELGLIILRSIIYFDALRNNASINSGTLVWGAIVIISIAFNIWLLLKYKSKRKDSIDISPTQRIAQEFEISIDGFVLLNRDGKIQLYNDSFTKLFSIYKNCRNDNFAIYLPKKYSNSFISSFRVALFGYPTDLEIEYPKLNRIFSLHLKPFYWKSNITNVQVIIRDVTEQKRSLKSLEMSNKIIAKTHLALIVLDKSLRIVRTNPFLRQLLETDDTHLLNSYWIDYIESSNEFNYESFFLNIFEKRSPYIHIDLKIKSKSEKTKLISWGFMILYDSRGVPEHLVGFGEDITEKKNMEIALFESEKKYKFLIEHSLDGIYILNRIGKIIYTNNSLLQILKMNDFFEVIGKNFKDITDESYYGMVEQKLNTHFDDPLRTFRYEFLVKCLDGETKWVEVSDGIIKMDNEEVIFGTMRDITNERNLREQISKMQTLDALGRMVDGIAHDFNNVLTGILGYSSHLYHLTANNEQLHSVVGSILKGSNRAVDMITRLRSFSRHEDYELVPLKINDVINESIDVLSGGLEESIKLKFDICKDEIIIMGDSVTLLNAILNILINAKDALPNGGKIEIITYIEEIDREFVETHLEARISTYYAIKISDEGIGMSEETQSRIFEPFFSTKGEKGTGLGLAQTFGTVKTHNGFIDVSSQLGMGTTFTIYLPVLAITKKDLEKEIEAKETLNRNKKVDILIIENEDAIIKLLSTTLEERGYSVSIAKTLIEGRRKYEHSKPQNPVIISDISLEGVSSLEWLEEIRNDKPKPSVILISGSKDFEKKDYSSVADLFLAKPFPMSLLINGIEKFIYRKPNK